jgi:hypothetical protein
LKKRDEFVAGAIWAECESYGGYAVDGLSWTSSEQLESSSTVKTAIGAIWKGSDGMSGWIAKKGGCPDVF